jgi:hypothetical protein
MMPPAPAWHLKTLGETPDLSRCSMTTYCCVLTVACSAVCLAQVHADRFPYFNIITSRRAARRMVQLQQHIMREGMPAAVISSSSARTANYGLVD